MILNPCICLPLLCLSAGGGLDSTQLPAETRWVVHLDFAGMRATQLGQEITRALEESGELELEALGDFERDYGLNPLLDLHAITLHGVQGERDAIAQVRTSAKLDDALQKLRAEAPLRTLSSYGVNMLAFGDQESDAVYAHVEQVGEQERLLTIAKTPELVLRAVQVRAGQHANLSSNASSAMRRGPSRGAWLFVASGLPLAELSAIQPMSHVADLVRGGVVELGEHEQNFFANVELDARSQADARRLTSILQGGLALLELAMAEQDLPEGALQLLQTLDVEQLGEGVRFSLRIPAKEFTQLLQQAQGQH